jgi:hypothetical protein
MAAVALYTCSQLCLESLFCALAYFIKCFCSTISLSIRCSFSSLNFCIHQAHLFNLYLHSYQTISVEFLTDRFLIGNTSI